MASLQGMNIDALEQSVLVIVRMVSYLPDSGSFMMKSKAIVLNGQAFSVGVMGNKGGWLGWVLLRMESATSHIQRIPSPSSPKAAPKLKYSHMVESTL